MSRRKPDDTTDVRLSETELRDETRSLNDEAAGREFSEDEREQWNHLNGQLHEREMRMERIRSLAGNPRNVETEQAGSDDLTPRRHGGVRMVPAHLEQIRSRALTAIDRHTDALTVKAANTLERFVEDDVTGVTRGINSEYLAAVGNPHYRSAFGKTIAEPLSAHLRWTPDEHEAMQAVNEAVEHQRDLGLGTQGGNLPVPFILDPTIILTSDGTLNPFRAIAKVTQVAGNTWEGITSAGVTASFAAEATEATDNSPTLTQPTGHVEKASCFVPFSIEVSQDWGGFMNSMTDLFTDAKDVLEATKFLTGLGHGSSEPQGLIAAGGATVITTTASTAVYSVPDVYSLVESLPPRFRPRATAIAHPTIWDKTYRLVAAADPTNAQLMPAGRGGPVLGIPRYDIWTGASTVASGNTIVTYGDFDHFRIIDRIGMQIELIPHLFGSANRFPTGQRGLWMYWRTTSVVMDTAAFRSLKVL